MSVEYSVRKVLLLGDEDPLSSGHFEVGKDFGNGAVLFPDERSAREAAIEYAEKLKESSFPDHFIVRRIETDIVWDGD